MLWAAIHLFGHEPSPGFDPVDFLISDGLTFCGVLIAAALLSRLDGTHLRDHGLSLARGWLSHCIVGLALGLATVALLMGLIAVAGGVRIDGLALHGPALWRSAILWGVTMIVLGLFEESFFRGYGLSALASGIGFWPAAILLSAVFGALHFFTKPMETVTDAVTVSLFGLFCCLTLRRTGSLWLAVGFHAAFDYAALIVVGAPNTGNGGRPLDDHLLATTFHGPDWITGGVTGIEASWLIFPVLALLFALFARVTPRDRPAPSPSSP